MENTKVNQNQSNINPQIKPNNESQNTYTPNIEEIMNVKPVEYRANKKLVIILFVILLLTAVAAIFFTNYKARQYRESIKPKQLLLPTPTTSEAEVSDWKTYINNEFGFILQYPVNYIVDEEHYTYNGVGFVPKSKDNSDNELSSLITAKVEEQSRTVLEESAFDQFITKRILDMCAGGMDNSESYCNTITSNKPITTKNNIQGFELYRNYVRHTTDINKTPTYEEHEEGPFYVFNITPIGNQKFVALIISTYWGLSNSDDKMVLKEIVDTLQLK